MAAIDICQICGADASKGQPHKLIKVQVGKKTILKRCDGKT